LGAPGLPSRTADEAGRVPGSATASEPTKNPLIGAIFELNMNMVVFHGIIEEAETTSSHGPRRLAVRYPDGDVEQISLAEVLDGVSPMVAKAYRRYISASTAEVAHPRGGHVLSVVPSRTWWDARQSVAATWLLSPTDVDGSNDYDSGDEELAKLGHTREDIQRWRRLGREGPAP